MSPGYVFICPRCGKGSTSEVDAEDGYCGRCHAQTGLPVRLSVGRVSGLIGHISRDSTEPVATDLAGLLRDASCEFAWLQGIDDARAFLGSATESKEHDDRP